MFDILQREVIYLWYYFSLQLEQIFGYWVLGMVLGSVIAVFAKDHIHGLFRSLHGKRLGIFGIAAASVLGIASSLCMYGTIPLAASFSDSGMEDDWLAAFMMSSILLNPQLILYSIALGRTVLALDLSDSSDADAFRQAVILAGIRLSKFGLSMRELYPAFLEVCINQKLSFFAGKSKRKFDTDKDTFARKNRHGRKVDYTKLATDYFSSPPEDYGKHLLKFFTESPRSFKDIGLGFLAPMKNSIDSVLYELEDDDIAVDEDLLYQILVLLFWDVMDTNAALDSHISDDIRRSLPGWVLYTLFKSSKLFWGSICRAAWRKKPEQRISTMFLGL